MQSLPRLSSSLLQSRCSLQQRFPSTARIFSTAYLASNADPFPRTRQPTTPCHVPRRATIFSSYRSFSASLSLANSKHPTGFVPPSIQDLEELRERVQEFTKREMTSEVAHRVDDSNDFPPSMWQKLGEAGFLGPTADEDYGGLAMGYQAHCVIMEELSRASASIGLSYAAHSQLCINQLCLNGNKEQKDRYLPGLIAGKKIGALAMSEHSAGSDVVSMRTTAKEVERDGEKGYEIEGGKMWITNGPDADLIVLYAKTEPSAGSKGMTAFIVDNPKQRMGFSITKKLDKLGMRGSNTGELSFDKLFIPASNVLGTVNHGVRVLMEGLDLERLVLSSGPLGIMQACLDVVLPFVHQREQFGQPLSKMQLVQGKIADIYTHYRAASAFTHSVARTIDENHDNPDLNFGISSRECTASILFAAEKATQAALDCVQLLGGMGYVNEMPAGRLLRDAKLYEIGAGTSEIRRIVIGRSFEKEYGQAR